MKLLAKRRRVVWAAHLVGVFGAAILLWAFSVPGFSVILAGVGLTVLAMSALIWTVGAQLSHSAGRTFPWWLPVAPVLAVVTVVLLVTRAPLHLRWELSRGPFQAVVDDLPPPEGTTGGRSYVTVPERIGTYRITSARHVPGGVIFFEANGAFFDDAGFAYLPDGPTGGMADGSFETPRFAALGDGWYRFTASW
ncbi:hypothetical protein [Micromonospora sp. URMC 103]|uniref:hypothetical protein n=1 Tax=Micromonospora sp. URMC 103 TaxID=3423406 RepID=UPI003F1D5578